MRKNLTVSLSLEDWRAVQDMVRSQGETYSKVFHRLIASSSSVVCDDKRVQKYKALLAPDAEFLADRAGVFARAGKRRQTPA